MRWSGNFMMKLRPFAPLLFLAALTVAVFSDSISAQTLREETSDIDEITSPAVNGCAREKAILK